MARYVLRIAPDRKHHNTRLFSWIVVADGRDDLAAAAREAVSQLRDAYSVQVYENRDNGDRVAVGDVLFNTDTN